MTSEIQMEYRQKSIEFAEAGICESYYNPPKSTWTRLQIVLQPYYAEFVGTLILVLFGCGSIAQVTFNEASSGNGFLTINFGFGLGLALGALVAGPISGGHLNPAVTFAKALFGEFSWVRVPGYMLAQNLGAFFGAAFVYMIYWPLFDQYDGGIRYTIAKKGTAGIFATFSQNDVPNFNAFITETFLTAILMLGILVITNRKHNVPSWGVAILLGLLLTGIGMCLGFSTGYAMNPARDFGPRVFIAMAGWGERVFTAKGYYFWIPSIAPFVGAPLGMAFYDFFIDPEISESK